MGTRKTTYPLSDFFTNGQTDWLITRKFPYMENWHSKSSVENLRDHPIDGSDRKIH